MGAGKQNSLQSDADLFVLGTVLISMVKSGSDGPEVVKSILDSATRHAFSINSR